MFANRKKLFVILAVVFILILIFVEAIILTKTRNNKVLETEEVYTIYVKINPLVKMTFKEEYKKCKNNHDEYEICSSISTEVLSLKLVNNDAKELYNDLNLVGSNLYEAILELVNTSKDNDLDFKNLEITTDSNQVEKSKIIDILQEKSDYSIDFDIYVNYEEYIDEGKLLQDEKVEEIIYLVTFDSNGGDKVENQLIKENGKAEKPNNPKREGYTFSEWQLNGVNFDFDTEIADDIILKAKWTKNQTIINNQTNNNQTNNNNNNNQTTTNSNQSGNNQNNGNSSNNSGGQNPNNSSNSSTKPDDKNENEPNSGATTTPETPNKDTDKDKDTDNKTETPSDNKDKDENNGDKKPDNSADDTSNTKEE